LNLFKVLIFIKNHNMAVMIILMPLIFPFLL
jgi:hypothetical protein